MVCANFATCVSSPGRVGVDPNIGTRRSDRMRLCEARLQAVDSNNNGKIMTQKTGI